MEHRTSTGSAHTGSSQSGLMNSVKERAAAQLSTQKGRATDSLDVLAQAVRGTTQQLRTDQHDTIAQYVERAADQLERFSSTVRDKDLDELLHDARDFARRQPALFIGGSFVVGLLAARFIKSSRQNASSNDYGASAYGGGREWARSSEHGAADGARADTAYGSGYVAGDEDRTTYGSQATPIYRPEDYRSPSTERY
jgi:hypothetical protein